MVKVIHEQGTWQQAVAGYQIKTEQDRVRKQSRDDYGLGPNWLFCCGAHVWPEPRKPIWTTVWVLLTEQCRAVLEPACCNGQPGSLQLSKTGDRWSLHYRDRVMIGGGIWCLDVDPATIPEDVKKLFFCESEGEDGDEEEDGQEGEVQDSPEGLQENSAD